MGLNPLQGLLYWLQHPGPQFTLIYSNGQLLWPAGHLLFSPASLAQFGMVSHDCTVITQTHHILCWHYRHGTATLVNLNTQNSYISGKGDNFCNLTKAASLWWWSALGAGGSQVPLMEENCVTTYFKQTRKIRKNVSGASYFCVEKQLPM